MTLRFALCIVLALIGSIATAQSKQFVLQAPQALVETGFLKHLLPRFSLKTGIRITIADDAPVATLSQDSGVAVFQDTEGIWRLDAGEDPHVARFLDWLRSDVGHRTILAFQPDGVSMFEPAEEDVVEVVQVAPTGDIVAGERLSLTRCGRCHVVSPKNRMGAIGSTPSFAVLRTLGNWEERFEAFYVLKPHGAFTQIEDVTPPFDPSLPSPIAPVELTLDELEAILAFVATISPADLGAPIQSQ